MCDTGRSPSCSLFKNPNTCAEGNDSIDTMSNYDSEDDSRSNKHRARLNTQLLVAVKTCNSLEVQRLLDAGADPNATCHKENISACHIAARYNNGILSILLKYGAEGNRTDHLGRTPLHLAAWAGNVNHVAALLNLSKELQKKFENGEISLETEEEIKELCSHKSDFKNVVDVRCDLGDLNTRVLKLWRDNIDHSCNEIDLPFLQPGWTPLHAAASTARHVCCRLLLASGADACIRDHNGRTPLDVAGSACLNGQQKLQLLEPAYINFGFTEVIKMLLNQCCPRGSFTKCSMLDTPLHTAVELDNLDAIKLLLQAGFSSKYLNRAGLTPLHLCVKKTLKQHLQTFIYVNTSYDEIRDPSLINVRDKDGYTVLHYAVLNNWAVGVYVALEARADIVIAANEGETSLHTAAALGNLDILKEILLIAKTIKVIDVLNRKGETPLFKAIIHGHAECVKMILNEGASIEITLPKQYNVFHVAAKLGHEHILKILLDHNYIFTREKVNVVTVNDEKYFGPIHFAVENNHPECVKLILSKNAYVSLKTGFSWSYKKLDDYESTPLHIAARKNNLEIAKIIVKFDPLTIYSVDAVGWTALHTAGYYGSRDVIRFLVSKGANLSDHSAGDQKYQKTAIELIMNNLSKPTEFMESIFDMHIQMLKNNKDSEYYVKDPDIKIKVDYSILVPKSLITQKHDVKLTTVDGILKYPSTTTAVIEALLKTGNKHGQRRLLLHPLVESFLCLKWKALLPFFYVMLFLNGLFVMTLTIFVMSEFIYKDHKAIKPFAFDSNIWTYALYTTIVFIIIQEITYASVSFKLYLQRLENWVKLFAILLAIILPTVIEKYSNPPIDAVDWPRHTATIVILLCWLNMTFLLSKFSSWGYYVLMFGKVSKNVLKILLTFAFLLIGFTLSFMIQFHHQSSFDTFWSALIKTIVMMTSEFDYDDLVSVKNNSEIDKKMTERILQSLVIIRLLFLSFLILAAIVLMNLMVGVAVNDLHNLEVHGKIMRLEKKVELLTSIESLNLKKVLLKLLPAKWKLDVELSSELSEIVLRPDAPDFTNTYYIKAIPARLKKAIFEKAFAQKKTEDFHYGYETLRKQLGDIHESMMKNDESPKKYTQEQQEKKLPDTDIMVLRMKRQIDEMSTKTDTIMQLLVNLSQK